MRAFLLLLLLLSTTACQRAGSYMDECETSDACGGDLVCTMVADLGYIALGDTGAALGPVCTQTCTADADCPRSTDCPEGADGRGRARDACIDGLCTPASCI